MGEFLEKLYDVLFHPVAAMRKIAAEAKIGQAAAAFFLSVLIPAWAMYFGLKSAAITAWGNIFILLEVVGSLLIWWFSAAFFHLIAELLGGQGKAKGLLSCMGFGYIPRIFIVPFWVMASLMPEGARTIFLGLSMLLVSVWTLVLQVIAIREAHQLTNAKSIIVLLSPVLLLLSFIAGLCILLASVVKLPLSFI